jgi:hypothetical protein
MPEMIIVDPSRPPGPMEEDKEAAALARPKLKKVEPKQETKSWYELDRYSRFGDLFLVIGFACVVGAVWYYLIPLAVMLIGCGLIYASILMGQK